ncbi:MAG TPA: SseB family protein, partial [Micrococcaceae bacterium]
MSPDAADVPDATGRGLPAHIAAALAAAGGRADSAGQDWAGRSLDGDGPYHNFEDDDGAADPAFAAAIAALLNGTG